VIAIHLYIGQTNHDPKSVHLSATGSFTDFTSLNTPASKVEGSLAESPLPSNCTMERKPFTSHIPNRILNLIKSPPNPLLSYWPVKEIYIL
jgi:hypothetical protein